MVTLGGVGPTNGRPSEGLASLGLPGGQRAELGDDPLPTVVDVLTHEGEVFIDADEVEQHDGGDEGDTDGDADHPYRLRTRGLLRWRSVVAPASRHWENRETDFIAVKLWEGGTCGVITVDIASVTF